MTEEEKKAAQKKSEATKKKKRKQTGQLKRALDFSNALVYNLLRKVIGCVIRLPSVQTMK